MPSAAIEGSLLLGVVKTQLISERRVSADVLSPVETAHVASDIMQKLHTSR
jgi:hypothetical protein